MSLNIGLGPIQCIRTHPQLVVEEDEILTPAETEGDLGLRGYLTGDALRG